MLPPGSNNAGLENDLSQLPDDVAIALYQWRAKTLDREKLEAVKLLKFKMENPESTATEIKAMIHKDDDRYYAVLAEAKAESDYQLLYERLMSKKLLARMRTAF